MTDHSYRKALFTATVLDNPWLIHKPSIKQAELLIRHDEMELLYGGAAGGGKSEALLMGALQFVDEPKYSAILFRRTYSDLALPGALLERAREWLQPTPAAYDDKTKTWRFPSGATLSFGYLDSENDRYRYQSSEFQYIGFDELTQFKERDYTYLFSRLRRLADSRVPLRMRTASNPGGTGHAWVKKRFYGTSKFISAKLSDNPHIDQEQYRQSLEQLDFMTRSQLLQGDWADYQGTHFRPQEWPVYLTTEGAWSVAKNASGFPREMFLREQLLVLITVDWATSSRVTSDFTAMGVFALLQDGRMLVLDMVNERVPLDQCVPRLERVCKKWRPDLVAVEAVGFQGALANECRRFPAIPEPRRLNPSNVSKMRRALPAIVLGENGRILLPSAADWKDDYVLQLTAFSGDKADVDDMVDVTAYAAQIAQQLRGAEASYVEQGPAVLTSWKEPF